MRKLTTDYIDLDEYVNRNKVKSLLKSVAQLVIKYFKSSKISVNYQKIRVFVPLTLHYQFDTSFLFKLWFVDDKQKNG